MVSETSTNTTIVRTERGLTFAGTRITLYDVMDYVTAGWPPKLIHDRLNLSDQQIADVMAYIEAHRDDVEAEYQVVLQTAQENRQYWEKRNRERMSLPVLTIGSIEQLDESAYRERCASRLVEIMLDIENYCGVGRSYIP